MHTWVGTSYLVLILLSILHPRIIGQILQVLTIIEPSTKEDGRYMYRPSSFRRLLCACTGRLFQSPAISLWSGCPVFSGVHTEAEATASADKVYTRIGRP